MPGDSLTRPTVVDTIHNTDLFDAPPMATGRAAALRVVLPGRDDPDHRVDGEHAPSLVNAVMSLLNDHHGVDQVEILTFPGKQQQEHILTPNVRSEQPAVRNEPVSLDIQPLADQPVTGALATAQETLGEKLCEYLPAEYGIEKAAVEFSPIGLTPVPASRLLLKDRHTVTPRNIRGYDPLAQTIQELTRAHQPHLIQTLVKENTGKGSPYLVTHRCAVFDPDQLVTSHSDYQDLVENGHSYDLARIWPDTAFSSNYRIPIRDYTKMIGNRVLLREAKYKERSHSKRIWQLYEGLTEYQALLAGQMGADPAYQDLIGYPRFPVMDAELRAFCSLVPVYHLEDPWAGTAGRTQPRITTTELVQSAPGVDHAIGHSNDATPNRPAGVANEGSDQHAALLSYSMQALSEEGYEVEEITQDTESRPDGIIEAGRHRCNLEIEVQDLTKPANLLTNNDRAAASDRPVVHVTADQNGAQTVWNTLAQPYRETTDRGTLLYNRTDAVTLNDGSRPLLPDGVDEAAWLLDHEGQLALTADGTTIASGDAEQSITTFEFDCPRYVTSGDKHKIVSADGETLDTGSFKSTLLDDWTQIRLPYVPGDLQLLDNSTIRYRTDAGLATYNPTPDWYRTASGKRDIYSAAVTQFMENCTTAKAGSEIRYDHLRGEFKDWLISYLGIEDENEIESLVPPPNEFGRALPDYIAIKHRTVEGKQKRFLRDRTLIYPRGLTSPDLPFTKESSSESEP